MRSDDLQIDWLRSFIAVADTGSFTAAAARVFRAQSRVSAHIASLESALGVQLVIRDRAPSRLTREGLEFLAYAEECLRVLESGRDAIAAQHGEVRGTLRIASFPGACALLLAPVIREFTARHPDVEIELVDGVPDEAMVAHGQVDVAFLAAFPQFNAANIDSTPVFEESVMAAVPADHPLAAADSVPQSALDGQRIVLTASPGDMEGHLSPVIRSSGVAPARTILVHQPTTVAAFANAGLGIGVLPGLAAELCAYGTLRTLPVVGTAPWMREISVVTSRRRRRSQLQELFVEAVLLSDLPEPLTRVGRLSKAIGFRPNAVTRPAQ